MCGLRAVMRHRGELVQMAGTHVQHMHKALTQMNLQIQHVIADLTGTTGLAILDAILAGERDPAQLAKWRDPRIKAKPEIIQKSLVGNWQPQQLFTFEAVAAAVRGVPAADCRMRCGDRTADRRFSTTGRSAAPAPAAGHQEESHVRQKAQAASENPATHPGIRFTHRSCSGWM